MPSTRCTVVITAYNAASDLPTCLDGLLAQNYPDIEVVLVDNASEDSTPQVAVHYGQRVRYVRLDVNRGVPGGYNAGAAVATGEILVFINADTLPQPGWLAALVHPLLQDGRIGISTSRILLFDAPDLVNTCGNDITWTGLTVCRGLGQPARKWQVAGEVAAASGVSLAIRRSLFETLGGFDETYGFYYEDTDLSLRAQLAGYRVWYAPDSMILHRYTFKFSPQKAFNLERNRWLAMLKVLRFPTLLLLLPGLALGEAMAWVYSGLQGRAHLRAKLESWRWLWSNRQTVLALRQATQAQRKASDRELLRLWSPQLHFTGTVSATWARFLERLTQPILRGYGALCRALAVW